MHPDADAPLRPFLTAEWRWLVMLNYAIDPARVARYVPRGTEVDFWDGRTFVSVVGFRFLNTRVLGLPPPLHRDFDEVNLRLYVRRPHPAGVRRGVVFVKEIVPRSWTAWVARTVYNENYVALPMRSRVVLPTPAAEGEVAYAWRYRGRWSALRAAVAGEPEVRPADSEESFITEHYWGYAAQRDGGTVEYQVEHPPWRVWRATHARLRADVAGLYGPGFADVLAGRPSSAFVADGSAVTVRRGRRLA